jgi:hypothetical protein
VLRLGGRCEEVVRPYEGAKSADLKGGHYTYLPLGCGASNGVSFEELVTNSNGYELDDCAGDG